MCGGRGCNVYRVIFDIGATGGVLAEDIAAVLERDQTCKYCLKQY